MDFFQAKDAILETLIMGVGVWAVYELRRLRESVDSLNIKMAKKETSDEEIKRRLDIIEEKVL